MNHRIPVTFAFVKAPPSFKCAGEEAAQVHRRPGVGETSIPKGNLCRSPDALAVEQPLTPNGKTDTLTTSTVHVVECVDFLSGIARSYMFYCGAGDTMERVYTSLWETRNDEFQEIVCYVPGESRFGQVWRPTVDRTLSLHDAVPERFVCQQLPIASVTRREIGAERSPLLVLNVLVMSAPSVFHVGHLPLVLRQAENGSGVADAAVDGVSHLLGLCEYEKAFIRRLSLVPCRVTGDVISLENGDGVEKSALPQLALLFPTLRVGDVVRARFRLPSSGEPKHHDTREYVVAQGTITRHHQEHGIRTFDVLCLDGMTSASYEVHGLTCLQLTPL